MTLNDFLISPFQTLERGFECCAVTAGQRDVDFLSGDVDFLSSRATGCDVDRRELGLQTRNPVGDKRSVTISRQTRKSFSRALADLTRLVQPPNREQRVREIQIQ